MADDSTNLFDQFDPDLGGSVPAPSGPASTPANDNAAATPNIFDQFDPEKQPEAQTSGTGAFIHGAERGVLPALGGMAAAGAGAELGAAAGAAIGTPFGGVGAVPGAIVGGIGGAIVGGIGGTAAVSAVQDWALKALPDSWKDAIGQSDEQQALDVKYHPTESFLGGLLPFALTMRPGGFGAAAALPENATTFQRIAANPVTARIFGGALMGGMELGNELAGGQSPNWTNIAISTGFGVVFNKPTRIGERLTELGAGPVRSVLGIEGPRIAETRAASAAAEAPKAPAEPFEPGAKAVINDMFEGQPGPDNGKTVTIVSPSKDGSGYMVRYEDGTEAFTGKNLLGAAPEPAATNVTGKDFTETMLGGEREPPTVAQAGDAKVMGPGVTEDVFMGSHEQAPDAAMTAQDAARTEASVLNPEAGAPDVHAIARRMEPDLLNEYDALTQQHHDLSEHLANIARDVGAESPEAAAMRQQIMATDAAMRDIAPQVSAAYRRAADAGGHETIEPETAGAPENAPTPTAEAPTNPLEAPIPGTEATPTVQVARPIEAQVASIAEDVVRQLTAAGQPVEWARAYGQLIAQRYRTRSARLGNPLGAEALYQAEGANIRAGGKQPVRAANELAQDKPPELFQPAADTNSPEFENWFKDSKVVDGEGKPAVVHHWTYNDFEAFDRSKFLETRAGKGRSPESIDAIGNWFSDNPDASYAAPSLGGKRIDAYLKIEKPLYFDDEPSGRDSFTQLKEFIEREGGATKTRSMLKDQGYDGIVMNGTELDGHTQNVMIAFDPTQIKSVANRGTFDPNDPRILFQPAYHGTPHLFDKFDSSKIGTGEGAQAFGHGLYFAGRKEVAQYYKDTLTGDTVAPAQRALKKAGDDVDAAITAAQAEIARLRALDLTPETGSAKREKLIATQEANLRELTSFKETGKWKAGRLLTVDIPEEHELLDWDKPLSEQPAGIKEKLAALGFAEEAVPKIADPEVAAIFRQAMRQIKDATDEGDPIDVLQSRDVIENDQALYNRTLRLMKRAGADPEDVTPGYWLAEQARPHIQAILDNQKLTGEAIYNALGERLAEKKEEAASSWTVANTAAPGQRTKAGDILASEALRGTGIPGHRFLDQQSRGATENQTHNYVIYDDSRVNVTNYEQGKRGSITFAEGRKPLIKLFQEADASTFIHETGHQWLEELMRDAVHPQADNIVKDDAQTVRDWLGIGDIGETIKTKQHEKFARGFEQYIREGVAPSPGLARVFAQFKQWLTTIYQSLKGLGTPVSDDIKAVFDRMIAEEPNRTVVAPEREGAEPSLSSIHEAEAAETHPAHAEPVGDRIIAERDAYIAQQPPEIQNELAAAVAATEPAPVAGAEGGAGPTGGPEVVAGSGEPQPVAPSGGGGGEPGAINGGGVQGMERGAGAQTGGAGAAGGSTDAGLRDVGPGAAGAARAQPLAPDPAHVFGAETSPFLDKAGNIRVENLTTNEDVAKAIHDAADANNDFIGERRGVITDGQMLDLADALGMDAAQLQRRHVGEAFNAESIIAARKLLIQSATDVAAVMKKAATGTDEDVLAYAQAKARHQMIQGQVAGLTAEAGRALRAFRSLAGSEQAVGVDQFLRNATGKTLFQLKEEIRLGAQLDTPTKVSKFVRDAQKRDFLLMVVEYWINALVSGPKTHVTNTIGNTIMSMQVMGPETAAAAMIGRLRNSMGREGTTVRLGEVGAHLRGAASALPVATKAAIDALKTGRGITLPGEEARALPFQPGSEFAHTAALDETATYADIAPHLFGAIRGITDGIVAVGKLVATGGEKGSPAVSLRYSPLGAIPDIAVRGTTVLPLGTTFRLPTRFLAAGDSFFRAMLYSAEKNAQAYRAASDAGLTGQAFDARVAEVSLNPTPEIMESSRHISSETVFMGRSSEFVQALSRLANTKILGLPLLKFVAPFINTPASIIEQAVVRRTPIGLFSPEIRADLAGKNGNIAQDTAMARMLLGSAYAIGFGALAAKNLLSGSGPTDPNKSALWRLAGNQPHSARIGDIWYDMRGAGPLGILAGISADMYDVAHAASEGDLASAGAGLQHAFMQNILDASWMTGPSDLIQALEDPARYGQSYIRNFASSFVPFSGAMGQIARATDPYSRQSRTIVDSIKAKVPGLSETLFPRRDIWGEAMPQQATLGPSVASSIYATQVSRDPVNQAMFQSGYWPGQPDRSIRGVALTDQQYDQYAMLAGRMLKQRLNQIVGSADWNTWSPIVKHDVVAETVRQSRETARGYIMGRYPSIAAQATSAKLAGLH